MDVERLDGTHVVTVKIRVRGSDPYTNEDDAVSCVWRLINDLHRNPCSCGAQFERSEVTHVNDKPFIDPWDR